MTIGFGMDSPSVAKIEQREQTDRSLRDEREAFDRKLAEDLVSVDETADAVICRARARANEVLAAARMRADMELTSVPAIVERHRLSEDAAVRDERAASDEVLRRDREARLRSPTSARDQTDKNLLAERSLDDATLVAQDVYLGVVGHELRNMIQAVEGFASLLENAAGRTGQNEQLLQAQHIQRAGARMNRLVGDLVDVASIHAGTLKVMREQHDPSHVVHEAVDSYQPIARAKNIQLTAAIVIPLGRAEFDPARILQVLVNLLSNAIKFTPAGGTVTLQVRRDDGELHFSVQDTGAGIPSNELLAVFERFHQVTKNDLRGVGLGLYISRCIVLEHGGRIWAESVVGLGSTFRFTLPAHSQHRV